MRFFYKLKSAKKSSKNVSIDLLLSQFKIIFYRFATVLIETILGIIDLTLKELSLICLEFDLLKI